MEPGSIKYSWSSNPQQLWARYLKGDKIPTKIGLGWVGRRSRSGWLSQLFDQSGSGSGKATRLIEFLRQFRKNWGPSRLNPIFSLNLGRVGISLTFPDFTLKSWGESGLASIYPDFQDGLSDPTRRLRKVGMANLDPTRLLRKVVMASPTYLVHSWSPNNARLGFLALPSHWVV